MGSEIRLNKYLAEKGYASRRGADALIESGRVLVNGTVATLGQKVTPADRVEVKDFNSDDHTYILYYKPKGIVTHSPEHGDTDILTRIKKDHSIVGVFPIGRLDKDVEGLIILTDDGRITSTLLDSGHGIDQTYEVEVNTRVTQTFLNRLAKGVTLDGYKTRSAHTVIDPQKETRFTITLNEGKKYHIKRMCATLGYTVTSLKRTGIATFSLKNLKPGQFHRLSKKEVASLKKLCNLK